MTLCVKYVGEPPMENPFWWMDLPVFLQKYMHQREGICGIQRGVPVIRFAKAGWLKVLKQYEMVLIPDMRSWDIREKARITAS